LRLREFRVKRFRNLIARVLKVHPRLSVCRARKRTRYHLTERTQLASDERTLIVRHRRAAIQAISHQINVSTLKVATICINADSWGFQFAPDSAPHVFEKFGRAI